MSRLLVFASAFSRLHADLIIVRLKRAGIAPALISLIHPIGSRPNSVRCWLGGSAKLRLNSGEQIAASGFLRPLLEPAGQRSEVNSLDEKLSHLGLAHEHRVNVENTLLENRVVLAVDVEDKSELATILQTLQRAGAEKTFATPALRLTDTAATSSSALRGTRYAMAAA